MRAAGATIVIAVIVGYLAYNLGFERGKDAGVRDVRERIAEALEQFGSSEAEPDDPAVALERESEGVGADEGVTFRSKEVYNEIATDGQRQVGWTFEYVNEVDEPLELMCPPASLRLVDDTGKVHPASELSLDVDQNQDACGGGLDAGDSDEAFVMFEIPSRRQPAAIEAWDPRGDGPDDSGGTFVRFDLSS